MSRFQVFNIRSSPNLHPYYFISILYQVPGALRVISLRKYFLSGANSYPGRHSICPRNIMDTALARNIPCENYMGRLFILQFLKVVATHFVCGIILWARSFPSLPGGNMVDGLPPVYSSVLDVTFRIAD